MSVEYMQCGCIIHDGGGRTYCALHGPRLPDVKIVDPEPKQIPPGYLEQARGVIGGSREWMGSPTRPTTAACYGILSIAESLERVAAALEHLAAQGLERRR